MINSQRRAKFHLSNRFSSELHLCCRVRTKYIHFSFLYCLHLTLEDTICTEEIQDTILVAVSRYFLQDAPLLSLFFYSSFFHFQNYIFISNLTLELHYTNRTTATVKLSNRVAYRRVRRTRHELYTAIIILFIFIYRKLHSAIE